MRPAGATGFEQARRLLQAQQMRVGEGAGKLNDIPQSKLQYEFKHAWDFGVTGNWNKANGELFTNTIKNHINKSIDDNKNKPLANDFITFVRSLFKFNMA